MKRKLFTVGLKSFFLLDVAAALATSAALVDGALAGLVLLPIPMLLGMVAVEITAWAAG
jgi:hypothetical protein